MRLALGTLIVVALAFGAAVAQSPSGGTPASPNRITVKNFGFDPKELTVPVGTEVEWVDETGRHTVTADNGSFKSGPITAGGSFKHRFDKAGVYPYYCELHGSKGGHDMAGVVTVK
jgi:plastocyanin